MRFSSQTFPVHMLFLLDLIFAYIKQVKINLLKSIFIKENISMYIDINYTYT